MRCVLGGCGVGASSEVSVLGGCELSVLGSMKSVCVLCGVRSVC